MRSQQQPDGSIYLKFKFFLSEMFVFQQKNSSNSVGAFQSNVPSTRLV